VYVGTRPLHIPVSLFALFGVVWCVGLALVCFFYALLLVRIFSAFSACSSSSSASSFSSLL
jgi:hypothetical protein